MGYDFLKSKQTFPKSIHVCLSISPSFSELFRFNFAQLYAIMVHPELETLANRSNVQKGYMASRKKKYIRHILEVYVSNLWPSPINFFFTLSPPPPRFIYTPRLSETTIVASIYMQDKLIYIVSTLFV